jgi:hypothetical protein
MRRHDPGVRQPRNAERERAAREAFLRPGEALA